MKRLILLFAILLIGGMVQDVMAQRSGHIDWNGWSFDYDVSDFYDGVSLKEVTLNGTKILEKASFPVMRVFYENDACGPYADRLGGDLEPVSWADNAEVVTREIEIDGEKWFEVGIEDLIGNYDLYQVWYLSEHGVIDAHTFARGLQCSVDHEHLPYWRLDFDIAGEANDQILQQTSAGWDVLGTEFDLAATSALNHGWLVRDAVTGDEVYIVFDDGVGNVPGEIIPETEFVKNNVFGRRYHGDEDEGWIYGAEAEVPFNDGENIDGEDIILWYSGFLPHGWLEGADLWHSTGVRLFVNPTLLVVNPGSQVSGLGDHVSLALGMEGTLYSATGLPTGLSINSETGEVTGVPTVLGTFQVTVTAEGNGETESVSFSWEITPAQACEVFVSLDNEQSIGPDAGVTTTSTVEVSGMAEILSMQVIDLHGTHTYMGDLDFQLASPAGTAVEIMERSCGSDNDFDLSLDDEASAYRPCPPVGGGNYKPDNPLEPFEGEDADGTWVLSITDNANADSGVLQGWGLNVCSPVEAPVDPPVIYPLGDLNHGIAAHDQRTGTGYIMFSEESVHTRFSNTPPSAWAADHLIAVVLDNGEWKIDRNKNVLVSFEARSTDRLVAEVDFSANTVNHLEGVNSVVEGIGAGYESGDLVIQPEMWNGLPNEGEFGVTGTEIVVLGGQFNNPPVLAEIGDQNNAVGDVIDMTLSATDADGESVTFAVSQLPDGLSLSSDKILGTITEAGVYTTTVTAVDTQGGTDSETFTWAVDGGAPGETVTIQIGDLNSGIAAHDQRTGSGYIMYSEESVHTRFADNPPSAWSADHLIAVVLDGGQWKIDRNKYTLIDFTPRSTDHLVAEVDFGANTVTHLEGVNTSVEGIDAGYESGDLVITAEMWGGVPNEGEFGVQGTQFDIATDAATGARGGGNGLAQAFEVALPEAFALGSIYPNPFGSSTTIEYQLPEDSAVRIDVFSITGQRIRSLLNNSKMPAGYWQTVWDGTNDSGAPMAAAVYIIRFQANGFVKTGKVVLIK